VKGGPSSGIEAFHGNDLPILLHPADPRYAPRSNERQKPHRAEHFQLSNRLFVDEATGALTFQSSRAKTIGERLICPLLQEVVDGLDKQAAAERSAEHRDVLKYLLEQTIPPTSAGFDPRRPYFENWQALRSSAMSALWRMPSGLEALTERKWESAGGGYRPSQTTLIMDSDRGWLLKQQTAKAFIELWRAKSIEDTEDFTSILVDLADETSVLCAEGGNFYIPPPLGTGVQVGSIVVIAAMTTHVDLNGLQGRVIEHNAESGTFQVVLTESNRILALSPDNLQRVQEDGHGAGTGGNKLSSQKKKMIFAKRFWHAVYGMLLWGRALQLKPFFAKELRRVLGEDLQILGPHLRPRADVLVGPRDPPPEHVNKTPLEDELERKEGPDQFADLLKAEVICPDTSTFARVWAALCHASSFYDDFHRRRGTQKQASADARSSVAAARGSVWYGGLDTTLEGDGGQDDEDDAASSASDSSEDLQERLEEREAEAAGLALDDPSIAARRVRKPKLALTMKIVHVHVAKNWEENFPRCAGILLTMRLTLQERGPTAEPPVELLAQVEMLFSSTLEARFLQEVFQLDPAVDRPAQQQTERWDPVRSRKRRPVHGTII